ncbi:MAG: hypothetical protein IH840_00145 [Candidatus Heimdallarchaeota archaeon]|nr:hypothetical protein [Candidatus Heimdallarchaeota archaeon]
MTEISKQLKRDLRQAKHADHFSYAIYSAGNQPHVIASELAGWQGFHGVKRSKFRMEVALVLLKLKQKWQAEARDEILLMGTEALLIKAREAADR